MPYPAIKLSRDSRVEPEAGIIEDFAEDGTDYSVSDWAQTRYRLRLIHDWITQAEWLSIIAHYDANGPAGTADDVDVLGDSYSAKYLQEPRKIARSGPKYRVETIMSGVRSGW